MLGKRTRTFENRAIVSFEGGFEEKIRCHLNFFATGKESSRESIDLRSTCLTNFYKKYTYVG
jgi:hypothetical protein